MLNNRFITYLCLIGASCSAMAMEMPEKPKNSPVKTVKIQSKKDQNLALLLETTYEVIHEIAIDLQKSLQELKKHPKSKTTIKIDIASRIPVLNELIGKTPNSYVELKKALFAFINVVIAFDRAKDIALLPNFVTAYETANNLLCSTIDSFDALKTECIICAEEKSNDDFLILPCGHEYCKDCLQQQVDTAIEAQRSPCCPNPSCKKPFEYEDIQEITANKNSLGQFNEIKFKEYLATQNVKQCKTLNCPGAFINERTDQFTIQCKECKHEYCAQCLHPHAFDMPCSEAEEMRNLAADKNAAEAKSEQWKKQNTKACPRCKTPVEKNGGCNHMSCRRCYYEFCWNCLGDWRNHSYCAADRNIQAQPVAQQAPREQINGSNAHFAFARDPRGFVKSPSFSHNRFINMQDFAARFERLSCEQRDEWTARVSNQIENSWDTTEQIWLQALATIERPNHSQNAPALQIYNPAIFIRHVYHEPTGFNTFTIGFDKTRINFHQEEHYTAFIARETRARTIQYASLSASLIVTTSITQAQMQEIIDAANQGINSHGQHAAQPANPVYPAHVTVHRNSTITRVLPLFSDIVNLSEALNRRGITDLRFDFNNRITISSDRLNAEELNRVLEDALNNAAPW